MNRFSVMSSFGRPSSLVHQVVAVATVALLLAAATANIYLRASWHEVEDGVLWLARAEGVVAAEVAPFGSGAAAGIRQGDVLLSIGNRDVASPVDVIDALHGGHAGAHIVYHLRRSDVLADVDVTLAPTLQGSQALYFVLAAVAIFSLLVGCAVRLRRPRDAATLHFFWLSVAFFGVFAFSFSGRLDLLDWFFYWADVVALLLLPPLFFHFALVFPDRPHAWIRQPRGRVSWLLLYAPAALFGVSRAVLVWQAARTGRDIGPQLDWLDRIEHLSLAAGLVGGLAIMVRALDRVHSVTARRQLRWIVWGTTLGALPFAAGYVLPFILGFQPWSAVEWLALPLALVPLAFASAVVRYRLMDVEVIIKRTVVYTFAVGIIVSVYAVLLRLASEVFLGGSEQHNSVIALLATLVVVLLAPPVKNAIQTLLDRAHYRDRYDYRQALAGFARDLNSDLDLDRLSQRLVGRVTETFLVDRMALLVRSDTSVADGAFHAQHDAGFGETPVPPLQIRSGVGTAMLDGVSLSFDDPASAQRLALGEVSHWREVGLHYFVPCVSTDGTMAVMALGLREGTEPLSSEDLALLNAIAAQVATAIEAGRLYQRLAGKAEELDRLREFSDNIIASLQDGLVVVDLDEQVVRWNQAMARLYGLGATEVLGQPLARHFDASFLEQWRRTRARGERSASAYRLSLSSRHPDGAKKLLVNVATEPLRTAAGSVAGTVLIFEDVTSRVRLEEHLQISDKMASIGLLAAGVAHEVNTPLTGIASFTQMLLEQVEPEDPKAKLLEKIERQTFRAAKIVNGLLNLARPPQTESGPVDLHVVINDVLSLLEHQLRSSSVQLRRDLGAQPSTVLGVEHKLQQVFLNLFINARDAMPRGGWLSVATVQRDGQLVVEVSDTGNGISADHLARIYDPFFTTKPIGQGTGLGLSISYGILREHDADIQCESAEGQGTTFILRFPLAARRSSVTTQVRS